MRGSTPLDVAAASVMDNNELALALREPDLEKVGGIPGCAGSALLAPNSPSRLFKYSCHIVTINYTTLQRYPEIRV